MNLNKVYLVGRLTRDPESRTTPSGQSVTTFGMATNRVWLDPSRKKQEQVEYHNIVAWGKLADICAQYLAKGRLVMVEGRLSTRSWDGPDGTKRSRTEIIAENMQMGPRAGGESVTSGAKEEAVPEIQIEDTPPEETPPAESGEDLKLENIPF